MLTPEIKRKLWQAADQLQNNLDAAEYKHVLLVLIFLKIFPMRGNYYQPLATPNASWQPHLSDQPDATVASKSSY